MSAVLLLGAAPSGTGGRVLIVVLVVLAVVALSLALLLVFVSPNTDVEERLTAYSPDDVGDGVGRAGEPASLAETKLIQEAVGLTGRLAERAGLLVQTEEFLEQAHLALRPAEALFFYIAGVLIVTLFALFLLPSVPVALLVAAAVAAVPVVLVSVRRRARLRAFEENLPDALNLLAGSLRAGFSLLQGVDAVAEEAIEPMRSELQRAFTEAQLGRPIEDALDEVALRMGSSDLGWTVMAIRIQREVGGNLAELLDTVADTMTQRERLRREIRALTAEGRLSGVVLGAFPPVFGLVLYALKPDYMRTLFDNGWGVFAVVFAVFLTIVGYFWLRRILAIEV